MAFSVSELAGVVCPPNSKHRLMALLRAYCDASFTHADNAAGWTSVAGYVGTEDQWRDVEREWTDLKRQWNLQEFSVANILAGRTHVGRTNAELCVRSFGKIIGASGLQGVSACINDADWEATYKSPRFPTKYHSCLSLLFHVLDQHIGLEYQGDQVAVICDTDQKNGDALAALCDAWRQESHVIASITFGRRLSYPMIECADLCAGSVRIAQMAGGFAQVVRESKWYSTSAAHKHRGAVWSLESQKQIEEAEMRRKERLEQRKKEGPPD